MKNALFLSTAVGAMLFAGAASADVTKFKADISGDQETCTADAGAPPDKCSTALGFGIFSFDTTTKKLCGKIDYVKHGDPAGDLAPLSSAVTFAHVHKADAQGGTGNPFITLSITANPITFGEALSDANANALNTGLLYVNIHTSLYPNGEMRGFIVPPDTGEVLGDVTCPGDGDGGTGDGGSTTPPGATPPAGTGDGGAKATGDGGTPSGTSSSSSGSDDGCSTTGSAPTSGLAIALGVGIALLAKGAAKRRKVQD